MIIKTKRQLLDCFDIGENSNPPWEAWPCITTETGIHAKPFDNSETLMTKAERQEMAAFEREIELNLPCTAYEIYDWAVLNDLEDFFKEEFLNNIATTENKAAQSKNSGSIPKTRKDNLRRAIEAAIRKFGGKPSFDELWEYFQNDRDETRIIQDFNDNFVFWADTRGSIIKTKKETLANRLSRIKD